MPIEHSDINRIERIGFPNPEYLEWELRLEREVAVEDEEIWPDGVTWDEWQKEKAHIG